MSAMRGSDLLDPQTLSLLRTAIERSPLIIELRLPDSPHPPERIVFNRFDSLTDFLERVARRGDEVRAWRFDDVCRKDNAVIDLSIPRRIRTDEERPD